MSISIKFPFSMHASFVSVTYMKSGGCKLRWRRALSSIKKGVFKGQEGHVLERWRACSWSMKGIYWIRVWRKLFTYSWGISMECRLFFSKEKGILPRQYPLEKILLAKFIGTDEKRLSRYIYWLLIKNRCLPDVPSQRMHRGRPLHGG